MIGSSQQSTGMNDVCFFLTKAVNSSIASSCSLCDLGLQMCRWFSYVGLLAKENEVFILVSHWDLWVGDAWGYQLVAG